MLRGLGGISPHSAGSYLVKRAEPTAPSFRCSPMAKKPSSTNRLIVIGITLVILLIPFGLYFWFHVASQKAYFTDRSHRLLARIGNQVVSRVEGLQLIIKSATTRSCSILPYDKGLVSYFGALKPFGTDLGYAAIPEKNDIGSTPEKDQSRDRITAEFNVGSANRLTLTYVYKQEDAEDKEEDAEEGPDPCSPEYEKEGVPLTGHFSVSVDTDKLFKPIVERFVYRDRHYLGEEMFEKVLVADTATGEVVFEYGMDGVGITDFGSLFDKSIESNQKGKGVASLDLSALYEKDLASGAYKLFLQPIQLTVAKTGSGIDKRMGLVVCGLTRSSTFQEQTFLFSYTTLLLLIVGVLLTTFSAPLIKLRLLGPKDALRKTDVVLTICSVFFGSALVSMTLQGGHAYITLDNQLDDQLVLLADQIDRNLRKELEGIDDQLDALNGKVFADNTIVDDPRAQLTDFQERFGILEVPGWLDPEQAAYPYFNTAMWVQASGKGSGVQRVKYTTRPKVTAFTNVTGRRYFEDAKAKKSWRVNVGRDRTLSISLEPVNSRTSGENVAVVSKLTPGGAFVSAVDTRLLSLYAPVLPMGYGFCVIESAGSDSGLVLFHSDGIKNLEENFFQECNNSRTLRAVVQSRIGEPLSALYLGRDQSLFVTPVADTPWTLVVFRDKQVLRTATLEIVTLTVIAFLTYAALLVIALALVRLYASKPRLNNLWPNKDRVAHYKRIVSSNCVLFLLFLVFLTLLGGEWLIVLALLFPALALLQFRASFEKILSGVLTRLQPLLAGRKATQLFDDWRRVYVFALASTLAVLSIAPTLAFFKLFRDAQVGIFLRAGQISLARGLENRAEQVRSQYVPLLGYSGGEPAAASPADPELGQPEQDIAQLTTTRTDSFLSRRLNQRLDTYESFFFGTRWREEMTDLEGGGPVYSCWLTWFLTTFSPLYNEMCVESTWLARGKSQDRRWNSTASRLSWRPPTSTTSDDEPKFNWTLESIAPTFSGITRPYWWLLVLLMVGMLAVCYVLVRFVARRLWLLDFERPPCDFQLPPPKIGNHLVISPPLFDHKKLFPEEEFLHLEASWSWQKRWWEIERILETRKNLPVVINHFEASRDDPPSNETKLKLVEKLLDCGRNIIIVSAVDPIGFILTSNKKTAESSAAAPKSNFHKDKSADVERDGNLIAPGAMDAERWAARLASFTRVIGFDRVDNSKEPDERPSLLDVVESAQRPWRYLQSIAHKVTDPNRTLENQVAALGDQAESYYRAIWSNLSREERLTLYQVGKHGLLSRYDPDLRGLMQRGLILCDPPLRLMDTKFQSFVIGAASSDEILACRAEAGSNWEDWKTPLMVVLLGIIVFLFATQKELFDSTLTLASAVTGGVAALLKLMGMFGKDKAGSASA